MKKMFAKIFGAVAKAAGDTTTIPGDGETAVPSPVGRRGKHSDFPNKSMRRGVQQAKERKQRKRRLELISESQVAGVTIARIKRVEQLQRREARNAPAQERVLA